jgi:glycosyltransferase involved in cell wall biosynthesis
MHILLIIEGTYPWYRGGVSEWIYQYLNHLPEFSFSILQIATDEFQDLDPSEALYPLTENVSEFVRISPPQMSEDPQNYLKNWYNDISPLLNDLKGSAFNTIHVTNTGFAGWLGAKLSRQMDIPMMLTEHAIYWREVEMGAVALECGYKIPTSIAEKRETIKSFKKLASFTYQHASQIVSVSESSIEFQIELGAKDSIYIPNGIPEEWLISDKQRSGKPIIGWVGRCAEMKNPLAFFDIVAAFRDMELSPDFLMLLSDANEEELEASVKAIAKEYPEVECIWNEHAKKYFKNFDFLTITSHNESQPLVMLESLAHKALPVGYEVGDLTMKYGLVFEPSSTTKEIVEELEALWKDASAYRAFVEERYQRVKNSHTWEQIFGDYKQLLLQMCEQEVLLTYE